MQIYALDKNKHKVSVFNAEIGCNYFCVECGKVVRARGGFQRKKHFYHLCSNISCRLSCKSQEHLQVQHYLQKKICGNVSLEEFFPSINRIADVVWHDQKIVFEVQCSPILEREVLERNRDYNSLGFVVVWILHDKRFNKSNFSLAEKYLNNRLVYFTNINEDGIGRIYDQMSLLESERRQKYFSCFNVNLSLPQKDFIERRNLPKMLRPRLQNNLFFKGDLVDCSLCGNFSNLLREQFLIIEKEQKIKTQKLLTKKIIDYLLVPYRFMLQVILRKITK